jgi:transposase
MGDVDLAGVPADAAVAGHAAELEVRRVLDGPEAVGIGPWRRGVAGGWGLLVAAFDPKTGQVFGRTAARHTSAEFVAFLEELVATQPRRREIHVILDNFSTHKTKKVKAFLAAHPRVHFHFTPTYSSWLNQVELWFAKIERDVIARGVFSSVPNLARKLMRYIRRYNREPRPIRWTYNTPKHRISPATVSRVTDH